MVATISATIMKSRMIHCVCLQSMTQALAAEHGPVKTTSPHYA
jgi:hypothetical protein